MDWGYKKQRGLSLCFLYLVMVKQWLRHQLVEVSSLPFFLAELYQQRPYTNNHYTLNINPADENALIMLKPEPEAER